jgi:hypothetical protein
MSAIIEVASIRAPSTPRKPGHVIDVSGASFEAWPEKLGKLQVGHRYAVEIETREWQGRPIRKITKAQPFEGLNRQSTKPQRVADSNAARVQHLKTRPAEERVSEIGSCPEPISGNPSATEGFSSTERAFVASIVSAFIAAGKVDLDRGHLEQAVKLARALWRHTLGGTHAQI